MTGMTGANGPLTRRHRLVAAISPAAMTACHLVLSLVLRLPACTGEQTTAAARKILAGLGIRPVSK